MTNPIPLTCPYCQGATQVAVAHCKSCDVRVEGTFESNEFSSLNAADLHFLRIFLQFEGRIRDMEAPLGLSYPTIRNRLTQLKEKVLGQHSAPPVKGRIDAPAHASVKSVLEGLEQGDLSFEESLEKIKKLKREKK